MKKCPKCHAEIEENARFCLYCMTSLEPKKQIETPKAGNKRWLYLLAAVLVLIFAVCGVFAFIGTDAPSVPTDGTSVPSTTVSDTASATTAHNTSFGNATIGTSASTTTSRTGVSSDGTTSKNTSVNSTTAKHTSADKTSTTKVPAATQPLYSYVDATAENAYPTGYSEAYNYEGAIVITKIGYTQASGQYVIPETIDGKKVIAVMPSAFCDAAISPTVQSVTLPKTVRVLWSDAFKDCCNLKDIYIKSAAVYIYTDAFPAPAERAETLTIHCAKDCRNFDYYYYRNIADTYGAVYQEWNG